MCPLCQAVRPPKVGSKPTVDALLASGTVSKPTVDSSSKKKLPCALELITCEPVDNRVDRDRSVIGLTLNRGPLLWTDGRRIWRPAVVKKRRKVHAVVALELIFDWQQQIGGPDFDIR